MEIVVFVTAPDQNTAEHIAETLVKEKLAACCNLVPNIKSIYYWEGQIQKDHEILMLIKTDREVFSKLEARIKELHPYQVPEIISVQLDQGNSDYLKWIHEVLNL